MKKLYAFLISFSLLTSASFADEGMWIPALISQLNIGTMTEMGLELSADDIYSINKSSLKDAIVALDHGSCTAELVSDKGLLLTNHHCGYGEIQKHSSVEHDYLSEGFWAMTMTDELPNPGKTATLLIKMEDVTEKIMSELNDTMSEVDRQKKISEISKQIEEEEKGETHYEVRVESLFKGNRFFVFVYETFLDVRLVGAPPSTIGKFGGDIDNWMWPRHTGDFSMFRIYTGPDGKPAEYSEENIPYKPKHYLPVSVDGIQEGDFAMVMGYPGRTQRYLSSFGVKNVLEQTNPVRVKIRTKKLGIIKEDMDVSDKVRIQYASKYSRSANYWKYSIGQNKGLKRLKVFEQKQQLEKDFLSWVNENDERKAKYGEAINLIDNSYSKSEKLYYTNSYLNESIFRGGEVLPFANRAKSLYDVLKNDVDEAEKIAAELEKTKKRAKDFFKDYNAPTDKKVTTALLKMYYENVEKQYLPSMFAVVEKKYKGNFEKYVDYIFSKSIFVDEEKMNAFIANPSAKVLDKDPAYQLMSSFVDIYYTVYQLRQEFKLDRNKGERLYLAGLLEMNPDYAYYPDANSTMRLTYGKVCDYYPADAVHYDYFTTLKGVMEKDDPSGENFFDVPAKMKEIYKNKDYGIYGEGDVMKVCFTTDNDITGGNSGSPVMNSRGELIGIAFDGNWEAMSGDIAFEPPLQRCINVDIRYVLLVIDKLAGAKHLVDEMTLVTGKDNITPPTDPVQEIPVEAVPE